MASPNIAETSYPPLAPVAPTVTFGTPWLQEFALPLWAGAGCDRINGGFHERLDRDARPVVENKRVRVQARQAYCFAKAHEMGIAGDWRDGVGHALAFIDRACLDPDGYLIHIVSADGRAIDAGPDLYDQAFYLLALAEAYKLEGAPRLRQRALDLLTRIRRDFAHPAAGYFDRPGQYGPLRANPHMHLLEAGLAWMGADDGDAWSDLCREMATLCRQRLIDPRSGALLEYFALDWRPLRGDDKGAVEPGHLYEWAWLLRQWEKVSGSRCGDIYERLFAIAEHNGVCPHRDVAMNALRPDFSILDEGARLWPQTERLKAAVAMAEITTGAEHDRYVRTARRAQAALGRYLAGLKPGLWRDKMLFSGTFVDEPSPASSFYHLVCAAGELDRLEAVEIAGQPGHATPSPRQSGAAKTRRGLPR